MLLLAKVVGVVRVAHQRELLRPIASSSGNGLGDEVLVLERDEGQVHALAEPRDLGAPVTAGVDDVLGS